MQHKWLISTAAVMALGLAGCSDNANLTSVNVPEENQQQQDVEVTAFAKAAFDDDAFAEPRSVNNVNFTDNEQPVDQMFIENN